MVVAAGAGDGEAEECLRHGVDLLVHDVHLELEPVALGVRLRSDGEESGGHEQFRPLTVVAGREAVPRDLLQRELVEGHVGVQGPDHVVPIPPGMRVGEVGLLAAALGVAGDVEPVAAPTLAEPGRRE